MREVNIVCDCHGVVFSIEVEAGARVEEGDPVIMIESMKMELPVPAPRSGRIAAIHVAPGDSVAEDQIVAVIEVE